MLTQAWTFISAWYNLPFTILLGLCLLLAGAQLTGFSGEPDQDVDADADGDFDPDVAGDAGTDLEHDIDGDADANSDADAETDTDSDAAVDGAATSSFVTPLAFLTQIGVGRAPLVIVLLILFGAAGICGWLLNSLVENVFGVYPAIALAAVLPAAFVAGGIASRRIASFIGGALPPVSTTATRSQSLVGRSGVVISPFVDERYGQVHLRDAGGTLISVFVITHAQPPIRRGDEVLLLTYDAAQRRYNVARLRT